MIECRGCNLQKNKKDFYKNSRKPNGIEDNCKLCIKKKNAAYYLNNKKIIKKKRKVYYAANKEKVIAINAKYQEANPEKHRTASAKHYEANAASYKNRTKEYIKKYPLKYKAHYSVTNALVYGKLKKLPCERCGAKRSQAHHPDYNKPLDVVWLCSKHHTHEHKKDKMYGVQ